MRSIVIALLALLPAIANAANPPNVGWNPHGKNSALYYSPNSFPKPRPPITTQQPTPFVLQRDPCGGGYSYQPAPALKGKIGGLSPAPIFSQSGYSGGNWGGGYMGNTYVPPGTVIVNPFCK